MTQGKIFYHKPSDVSTEGYTDISETPLIEGVPEWREYWTFTHSSKSDLDLILLKI